jgi:subtilisin family serine protease
MVIGYAALRLPRSRAATAAAERFARSPSVRQVSVMCWCKGRRRHLTTHVDFGGRASVAFDDVGDGGNGIDCHGHGTHVAGTIGGSTYGVAKFVSLYAVRVLGCDGSGANKPAVANMSLGGGFSAALSQAVTNSIASGITYTVAAGNSDADACTFSPSSTPGLFELRRPR